MAGNTYELAVIGGGVGGAASALRAGQYGLKTAWILGDKKTAKRSRAQWVRNVDNMLGVHPGIVLSKLRKKWKKRPELVAALDELGPLEISTRDMIENARARLLEQGPELEEVFGAATGLSRGDDGVYEVATAAPGEPRIRARNVILATGAMDRQPEIALEKDGATVEDVKWIYPFANRETILYCIRCEGHLTRERPVAVIGAGESAGQLALMLEERYQSACCVLTNGETPAMAPETAALLEAYGIAVRTGRITGLTAAPGARGELRGITLEGGEELDLHFALVSLGMYKVYNELAREVGCELVDPEKPAELRRVAIDANGETDQPGVFAVGDLAKRRTEGTMMQIYTAQEYAVRAVDTVDRRRRKRARAARLAPAEA